MINKYCSSSADEKHRKKTKKKKEKGKKRKENDEVEHLEIGAAVPEAELQLSTVKPEDLPEEPEHQNVYLMRRYFFLLVFFVCFVNTTLYIPYARLSGNQASRLGILRVMVVIGDTATSLLVWYS